MKAVTGAPADARRRADALLDRLLELPPPARAQALEAGCGGDAAVRAEVLSLLALVEARAPGLDPGALTDGLRQQAIEAAGPRPEAESGERIGPWRVLSELGRGGMGTVYLVDRADGQFEQKAALKLVRAGRSAAASSRRFEIERQILASLNHASIARLLDGGSTADGRPFFVMEHVAGRTIDRHADEARLTVDERLDLFARACLGIQHAHRRLVVHRDIKPSNIIVTADGEVKLLDFGIARLLSADDDTDPGFGRAARVLTPDYATPEAARGESVATASDIYQLGLLLYELLCGERAQRLERFDPVTIEEVVCRRGPVPPSVQAAQAPAAVAAARRTTPRALARRLRGDLDAIVLRALAKEPEKRYPSVGELLADIQRYRRGLPVQARGGGVGYRLGRFVVRQRVALAWSAVMVGATAWVLPQMGEQRLRAAREAERAGQVERILTGMFTLPNLRVVPRPPVARDYLDHAVVLVRREMAGQPESQAHLLATIGAVYNSLGLYGPSIEVFEDALALRRTSFGDDSAEVADVLAFLSLSQHFLGRYAEAERNGRAALDIRRRRFGDDDEMTVASSIEVADLLHTRGALAEAEPLLRRTLAALDGPPERPEQLARASRDLANVLRDRGRPEESERLYRRALELFRDLDGPTHVNVSATSLYFARLLTQVGKHAEAEYLLVTGLASLRETFDGEHPLTGMTLRNLGYLRTVQGRYDEAERALADSEAVLTRWLGAGHPMVSRTRAHQAELAFRRGQPERAATLAARTLGELRDRGMGAHPSAIDACLTLGESLVALGRAAEAATRVAPCAADAARQFVDGDTRTARLRKLTIGD